ncbi:type II secretion system F family protein [Limobrevibacterium gyesilva]|uniref:Type II secretion system F family protein n=1 Tax=Limobrevibacterium gyesilva TaxID=2991712 RepID=A0AA41YNW2_9PROT|nr:type II secretion system F family protein [Limobrevibacterium gyesilva]MCW3475822.1 type II secretion system F family protein [Limobrevibacterium gyesilva]
MIPQFVVSLGVGASLVMLGAGALLMRYAARQRRVDARLEQARAGHIGAAASTATVASPRQALKMIAGMGQGILRSGILSSQTVDSLQQSLYRAGIRGGNAVAVFVAAKIVLAVVLPVAVFLLLHNAIANPIMRNVLLAGAAVGGLLAPDYVVSALRKRYQAAIADGLPDALDMLVMCAESGLSLEPAIQRVGTEIQSAHPAVGTELLITSSEFQISSDSSAVLYSLGERTGLAEVKRVVATLAQTLQYGTPLAEALRVLSAELRQEILTRFEERAARLPVLLTLPMILFILPSLFMVVGGPAMLQAVRLFKH